MTETQAQQDCKYCHEDKRLIEYEDAEFIAETWVHDGFLLEQAIDSPEGVAINFCPMCGRNLVKANENE